MQKLTEAVSSQQLTSKYNKDHAIIDSRDKSISGTNLQVNRSILNNIRHIQSIGNKIISLPKIHQHQITLATL